MNFTTKNHIGTYLSLVLISMASGILMIFPTMSESNDSSDVIPEILLGSWSVSCKKLRKTFSAVDFDIRETEIIVTTTEFSDAKCKKRIFQRKVLWSVHVPNDNYSTDYGRAVLVNKTSEKVSLSGNAVDVSDNDSTGYTIYMSYFPGNEMFRASRTEYDKSNKIKDARIPENRSLTPDDRNLYFKN